MSTWHRIIFGDCKNMEEIPDGTVHLMVTSPPYYNAPFDYPGLFKSYDEFLQLMRDFAKELHKKLAPGRIAAFVTDDMLVKGEKYPVVADITRIMVDTGFRYRDKITWRKPEGYIRISRRSGVVLQHPYPMYFYPDNIQESIIIFQKGKFDYGYVKKLNSEILEASQINIEEYQSNKWYLTVWDITNVLPLSGRLEEGIAAFPEEIPRRLIKLYTFAGETVLDPFLGSGTTTKVAKELGRNSYGYEIDLELKDIVMQKIGYGQTTLTEDRIEIMEREDARKLRTFLQEGVRKQRSVTKREVKEPIPVPVLVDKPTHQPDLITKETRVPKKETRSGWAKLKIALPNVEAVEKRIEEAKKKGVSAGYLRTLERLKRHWEMQEK